MYTSTNEGYLAFVGTTVTNTVSATEITAGGAFSQYVSGCAPAAGSAAFGCSTPCGQFEWCDVAPAIGRLAYFYVNFDGSSLKLAVDWFYHDSAPMDAACFSQVNAWTGGGAEHWLIKVYGDGTTVFALNGVHFVGPAAAASVEWGRSPLAADRDHSMFELELPASAGSFGFRMSAAGPRFGCDVLETDAVVVVGEGLPNGGSSVTSIESGSFVEE